VTPSRNPSRVVFAVAGVLAAAQILAVEVVPAPATSLLLSDLLQTTIILWAAWCALRVAWRSIGYLRQLWTLFAVALFIAAAAQGLETYYQNITQSPILTPWPSDILFLLWVTPAVMMLLPRTTAESGGIDWPQILDFVQVVIVALTAYLYFFYLTPRWEVEGPQMVDRILRLQMFRDAALAMGFLGGVAISKSIPVRAFFTRMTVVFLLASGAELTYFFGSRATVPKASWNDIIWCAPYLFAVVFAATWRHEKEHVPEAGNSPLRIMVVSQILPIGIPLLVLFMGRRIATEQITIAWCAVAASFLISGTRLVSTNERQRRAERALRISEQQFRNLIEELHVGVVLLNTEAEIQFANRAALQMFGLSQEEVAGKKSSELNLIAMNEQGTEIPFAMRPVPRAISSREAVRSLVMGWKEPGSDRILWVSADVAPIFRENGDLDHVIASFSNITERRQAEDKLHRLSAHLLQLQDEERRRLGRELHDSLAQSVMAVNLDLAQVARSEGALAEGAMRALSDARATLRQMSREIRTLSYMLHPPVLDEMGLASAVKEYAEGFSARSGIELELELQPDFGRLPQETETALFRIVQESLANIQKHSGSRSAKVRLRADSGEVELEVCDHGRGLGKGTLENKGGAEARLGVGIMGMRERMAQLGGKLDVESSAFGTIVRAKVQVVLEAAHATSHLGS